MNHNNRIGAQFTLPAHGVVVRVVAMDHVSLGNSLISLSFVNQFEETG